MGGIKLRRISNDSDASRPGEVRLLVGWIYREGGFSCGVWPQL